MAITPQEQFVRPASERQDPAGKLRKVWSEETGALSFRSGLINFLPRLIPAGAGGRLRAALYRALGIQVGDHSILVGAIQFGTAPGSWQRIKIGRRCFVNDHVFIDAAAQVTIGSGVAIGHHVVIITTDHIVGPSHHRAGAVQSAPVTIGDGAWIAAGAVILPGVTVGAGAVVAAGAVVRKDVPPNALVGGIPARVIRQLD